MSGNGQDAPAEDALLVLTAAMLTPGGFPGVLGDDYAAACAQLGLEPLSSGYGLVFGQDSAGARWTVATTDAAMVACALAAWDCGLEYDLSPDERTMVASLPGWPLPVAVAVPGIPEPHDPDEEISGGPALTPPDTSVWGPRQRRLGADEIAIRWHDWRDQLVPTATDPTDPSETTDTHGAEGADGTAHPSDAPATAGAPEDAHTTTADDGTDGAMGGTADAGVADGTARGHDHPASASADDRAENGTTVLDAEPATSARVPSPAISHAGVRHVLASAEAYVREPPPPGRVRTMYGAVRADGPGWSLVARTDDMAFVLLDDAPGEVLPVGRGPSLPPLLEALGRLAAAEVSSA